MGRDKSRSSRVRVDMWMLESLHRDLVAWSNEHGWSKTKTIEYAVSTWLNQRAMEAKAHGLVKTK